MEYIDGSDLREVLRREGTLEPSRAIDLVGQVGEALDAAHEAGLVHRDVKPGNVLVTERADGEHAYVCDFGLARHVSSVSSLTGDRGFVGTIDYVPPEQIAGGEIDGRADVYSLGCVLFECLAGSRPYERDSELSVVFAHLNEPPPRLSDFRPELPQAFDEVFATALAKSPDDRYATCGELVAAARAALARRDVSRAAPDRGGAAWRWRAGQRSCRRRGDRRRARDARRWPAAAGQHLAGRDRGGDARADGGGVQEALRAWLALGPPHRAQLPRPHLREPQAVDLLRPRHGAQHHRHDLEPGSPDGGRRRPVLEPRRAEVRLRQRAEAVPLEHAGRERPTPTPSARTCCSPSTAARRTPRSA